MEREALKQLFDEIVDAIHEGDGQTDGIAASRFPERIRAIPTGSKLEGIEIKAPPSKVDYKPGELFDPTGMSVWAVFSDGQGVYVNHQSLTFDPAGPLEKGTEAVTVRFSWGEQTAEAAQEIHVNAARIYGAEWDGTSTTKLSRTDAAAGFIDPVPAVGNGEGSSPFDDLVPWAGMVRKTQDGNELVAIPKYWLEVSHNPFRVRISSEPVEGFQVSPAHRDRGDGQGERDVVYIGRYACDDSYRSRSGAYPKDSTALDTFRSGIHSLGAEYWQADYALQLTWWYLYLVEFADWDGQTAVGRGCVNRMGNVNSGLTDSMTYHTGWVSENEESPVQYRYIENPWGNVREWRDGITFSDANISTYNNPANFSDSYNGEGAVVRSNKRCTSPGWIKAWGYDYDDPSFIYPSEIGGAQTTFIPDRCEYSGGGPLALSVGGHNADRESAGPFYLDGSKTGDGRYGAPGSRLMKLPNKEES